MKQTTNTIVLTGGGSGGHITPLLSLAEELKKKDESCKLIYIALKGDPIEGLQSHYRAFDEVFYITSGKFRRYHGESALAHLTDVKTLVLNTRDFFRVIHGTISSRSILSKTRPSLVFSKGGYVAVPVGIAAHIKGIPILTHDSDAIPGLANRIIGKWAKLHATGMPPENYTYPKDSIRYTGIPINSKLTRVSKTEQIAFKQELGLKADNPVLLVIGGGLGSKTINDLVLSSAPELVKSFPKLRILHIAGKDHSTELDGQYKTALGSDANKVEVLGFTPDLYKYSGAADLVVARAGATSIAELAAQGRASVIIPSPFLTGGHQMKNAKVLETVNAARILSNDISPEDFAKEISALLNDEKKRQEFATNLAGLARPDAAKDLADVILAEARVRGGQ